MDHTALVFPGGSWPLVQGGSALYIRIPVMGAGAPGLMMGTMTLR